MDHHVCLSSSSPHRKASRVLCLSGLLALSLLSLLACSKTKSTETRPADSSTLSYAPQAEAPQTSVPPLPLPQPPLSAGGDGDEKAASPVESMAVEPEPSPADDSPSYGKPTVITVQGAPKVFRGRESFTIIPSFVLVEGDRIEVGSGETVEFVFNGFATVRVLSNTVLSLNSAPSERGRGRLFVDLALEQGTALVRARSLQKREELVVSTANAVSSVRGTSFLVRADLSDSERIETVVAVSEGRVAVLPKGSLLENLMEGRRKNPVVAGAVRTAFAFAPAASAGEELSFASTVTYGAAGADPAIVSAEELYYALSSAAEQAAAQGLAVEQAEDPRSLIAPPNSPLAKLAADSLRTIKARALTEAYSQELKVLEKMQDPLLPQLPAALPVQKTPPSFFEEPKQKSSVSVDPAISWTLQVASTPLSESLTRAGNLVIALDDAGSLYAVDGDSSLLWTLSGNFTAVTALSDTILMAVDGNGVSVMDAQNGERLGRSSYDLRAAAPRTKAIPVPGGAAIATGNGILIVRAENAELVGEVRIPGGVSSTPVLADRLLAVLSGDGSLVFVDTTALSIVRQVPLSLGDCRGLSPRARDGAVYAADRAGFVVKVASDGAAVSWKVKLSSGARADLELGSQGVYVWTADHTIYALSVENGNLLAPAVSGAASPPLLSSGVLYWTDAHGSLVAADPATLIPLHRYEIAEAAAGRPIMIDGMLYVGTSSGKLLKVDVSKP